MTSTNKLGIDIGTSAVKLVLFQDDEIRTTWEQTHHGKITQTLQNALEETGLSPDEEIAVGVTGANACIYEKLFEGAGILEEIPAIVEGTKFLVPGVKSVIEIGSQGSRFITNIDTIPQFATNGHCAGGTGSFFEDQMSRLGLSIEDYSTLANQAESVPRLSGRCAVFAKTDIIHRQQEGVCIPDILLGLCYAMIKNYKAVIVGALPVNKPVAFCGGVTKNSGVIRAIREVFSLSDEELIVPEYATFAGAVGAGLKASGSLTISKLQSKINALQPAQIFSKSTGNKNSEETGLCDAQSPVDDSNTFFPVKNAKMQQLVLRAGTNLSDPEIKGTVEDGNCTLGIDIGSTSTDLVLIDEDGNLCDYQYLRTAGNPTEAVQKGLFHIRDKFGEIGFRAVGVTGSGRERIGKMLGADAIIDEITAQAAGAARCVPCVDTVFEIGGQDSKYISLKHGEVVDFQMNKICAAGTGSFVEEQAARMGIEIKDFGKIALSGERPTDLGERCTVFIETAIASASAEGALQSDIAAGLCNSIVKNYLHKVVGNKPIGEHIVLQGGVAYNPGIVAAFQQYFGEKITVNPYFPISGAYGVALLAKEAMARSHSKEKSSFVGYDFAGKEIRIDQTSADVRENIAFYQRSEKLLLDGYTGERKPGKKTVGVPFVLMIHKFFPMANAFFKSLGYNVILTQPTNEETIRLSQEYARGETCYPVKLIYGHMKQLIDLQVDYIFLPTIHTMKHEHSHVEHNYGCVYMQTAAVSIGKALGLEEKGITLLSPVFDLDFGKEAMASAMLGLGKVLGIPKPFVAKALLSGANAVRKHTAEVEKLGSELLGSLKPDDKVLVLITRNYGVSDPILNMGIPRLLLERGYKVITLSHLPGHALDISDEYDNLYWPFGQHIISGAKLIVHHPNLYAVYLTNHGCGPDSMLSHLFKLEMGDKPYLQIEVDEHFSKVGVITRIEAFLNSLSKRDTVKIPDDFKLEEVEVRRASMPQKPDKEKTLYLPDLGAYTLFLRSYFETNGQKTTCLPPIDDEALACGRSYTNSKEYLTFPALLGNIKKSQKNLRYASTGCVTVNTKAREDTTYEAEQGMSDTEKSERGQYLLWQTLGSEADGHFARVIYGILQKTQPAAIVAPMLESIPKEAQDFDLFVRTIFAADLRILAHTCEARDNKDNGGWENAFSVEKNGIPSWDVLESTARKIGCMEVAKKRIGAVGEPMCLEVLNDGILEKLSEEYMILRAPLIEYLYFLWADNGNNGDKMNRLKEEIYKIGTLLGKQNPFTTDFDRLKAYADEHLSNFAGANGRYRLAKTIDFAEQTRAVLEFAPRYENTAMILEMRGIEKTSDVPVYQIALDHDWDETSWSKLRSFLYYVG